MSVHVCEVCKPNNLILALIITMSASSLFISRAEAIPVPPADCGFAPTDNCLTFGDFNVFSLPLLTLRETGDSVPSPGDTYYAPATYGAIKNDTIIGINNGQYTETGNPSGSIDGSYDTPSPNNDTSVTFSTRTTDDPYSGTGNPSSFTSEFSGDVSGSWDANVNDLIGIDGTPLTILFAFNETGSGTGLDSTDLLIWAMVKLLATDTTKDDLYFFLGGDVGSTGSYNTGYTPLDDELPPAAPGSDNNYFSTGYAYDNWVYVHSGICADAAGNFLGFPQSDGSCTHPDAILRNQNNLGQNAASFMMNSPEMDAALLSGDYYAMQATWEMAYINGGGETAWIIPQGREYIPEPATLLLFGLGLAGIGYRRHKFV